MHEDTIILSEKLLSKHVTHFKNSFKNIKYHECISVHAWSTDLRLNSGCDDTLNLYKILLPSVVMIGPVHSFNSLITFKPLFLIHETNA